MDINDNYIEMKPLTKGVTQQWRSAFAGRQHLDITVSPTEINYVSFDNLKGFYIKGAKLMEEIKILKMTMGSAVLGGVISFLRGMPGGQNFTIENPEDNLYTTEFRCSSDINSQFCEFVDQNRMSKNLLSDSGKNRNYLFFMAESSPEKGGKAYVLCFR